MDMNGLQILWSQVESNGGENRMCFCFCAPQTTNESHIVRVAAGARAGDVMWIERAPDPVTVDCERHQQ